MHVSFSIKYYFVIILSLIKIDFKITDHYIFVFFRRSVDAKAHAVMAPKESNNSTLEVWVSTFNFVIYIYIRLEYSLI